MNARPPGIRSLQDFVNQLKMAKALVDDAQAALLTWYTTTNTWWQSSYRFLQKCRQCDFRIWKEDLPTSIPFNPSIPMLCEHCTSAAAANPDKPTAAANPDEPAAASNPDESRKTSIQMCISCGNDLDGSVLPCQCL